jgi:hypothetical protein
MGLAGFERNSEALAAEKAKQDQTQGEFGANADMIYALDGQTMMRVLPPYSAQGVFFKEIAKHRVQIAQDDIFIGICPEAMGLGEDCPICAKGEELYDTKEEASMAVAKDLKIRKNFIYNVIVFSGPPNKKGESPEQGKVYCFEGGVMIHRQIMELDQDPAAGWADITSPSAGVNLLIKRTGKGLNTKYAVNPHGGGRTDIFKYLIEEAGVPDPNNTLSLFNLDEVYTYDADRTATAAGRIKTPRGSAPEPTFAPAPVAAPVAAPAPVAVAVEAPVAVAVEVPVAGTVTAAAPVEAPVIPGPPAAE